MTDEQIETLKTLMNRVEREIIAEQYSAEIQARKDHHAGSKHHNQNAIKRGTEADALRAALALAEQARAMEGWEAVTYLRGDTIATRQGDGQWYIEDETRFQYLGYEGVWAGFESREVFADKESAIAAANAAMKAALPPTAEESSADRTMK
jgi:hypothetical protein